MTAFDAKYEINNAIGESLRDGKIVTVTARTDDEAGDMAREAERAAEEEGGGRICGYWHGAHGNNWRVRVALGSSR